MDLIGDLRNDIDELKTALLDSDVLSVSPPDSLTRRQKLVITSFVILAHAHIEEFIEELFMRYVREREKEITNLSAPQCFIRLSLHFSADLIGQQVHKKPVAAVCETTKHLYKNKVITSNNGLKATNVASLAKPLGLDGKQLDDSCEDLFKALNTLGAKRGKMAHTSSASQVADEDVYASQAVTWVEDVVNRLDDLLNYLHSTI
ncbi:HEPN domain-containing protein [Streptomyces albogriseolus]|uniref:HEPN domain-containing protein n=1 Tax=Streptomyces albogriseolus TaxID=1887 RepID=UPI0036AD99D2